MRVQLGYSGIRREEERVRRRRKGGYIEGTGRIQWGYSESTGGYSEYTVWVHWGTVRVQLGYSEGTVGYSEDTLRVHRGTVRVQFGYSEIRREEERVRRRREGGYIEGTGRIQWGYSESTVGAQ